MSTNTEGADLWTQEETQSLSIPVQGTESQMEAEFTKRQTVE